MRTDNTIPEKRSPDAKKTSDLAVTSSILMAFLLFAVDVQTPRGIADGMLYVCPLILALWARHPLTIVGLGILTTLFTVMGYFLSPPASSPGAVPLVNRGLSVIVVWSAVVLLRTSHRAMISARFYRNRLQILFDHVDQGILLVNRNGSILLANPRTEELTGYTAAELLQRNLDDLLTIRSLSRNNTALFIPDLDNTDNYSGKEFICKLLRRNAQDYDVSFQVSRLSAGSDLFAVFLRNISESLRQKRELQETHARLAVYAKQLEQINEKLESRVRERTENLSSSVKELETLNIKHRASLAIAEQSLSALLEREQLLNTIADNFPNGLIGILGRDSCYVLARGNDPGLPGNDPTLLIGSPFIALRYREQREYISGMLSRGFAGEKIIFEYHDPATGHDYLVNGAPLDRSGIEVTRLLVVSQDVTPMKKAESDMKLALAKEVELNITKSNFVTTASHEFRTPLGAILSSASLISMYNGPGDAEKRQKHVKRISASVAHLTQILNECLSLSRIENGRMSINDEKVDLNEMVAEVLEELSLARAAGQKINVNVMPCPLTVFTDRHMIRAILINLTSNALKYSTSGGDVQLDLNSEGPILRISVSDKGIGIPAGDHGRLFESFYRASNVRNIEGTGIGLHIVKKYVELLGGSVTFDSRLGQGSTFSVELHNTNPAVPQT